LPQKEQYKSFSLVFSDIDKSRAKVLQPLGSAKPLATQWHAGKL
jgi:hypothetical protein